MKKILSLVLAALMIFSVVPAAFAAETSAANGDSAYREALDFLATVGFYKGGAGVADKDNITRWQMALFVSRLVTGQIEDSYWATTENDSGFADVAKMEGYQKGAIAFAAAQGIINGYDENSFGPNDGITYRDALTMVVRALGTNYPASGYPWSYIAKARELGLMDGINGIGWTDTLKREAVAQILYNAFFAEADGKTVAEDIFGVSSDVVLVTASKNVKYEANGKTLNATDAAGNQYVQVAVVNAQGEPEGAKYHILGKDLGLKDVKAQNAAVGTGFKVYHKDNFAEILLYEDLNSVYKNEGSNANISVGGDEADVYGGNTARYLYLSGKATKIVTAYTNLLNTDRGTTSVKGAPEVKLYGIMPTNATVNVGTQTKGNTYVMYPDGWIYTIATLQPVGYYSQYLDAWYKFDATTEKYTAMAKTDAIYLDLNNTTVGSFNLQNAKYAQGVGIYSKVVATDLDSDGFADRAILRNYKLGIYNQYTPSSGTNKGKVCFTLYTGPKAGDPQNANSVNSINKFANLDLAETQKAAYRFTGLEPGNGSNYVLYYLDTASQEVEIIEVISKKSDKTTDTYWSTGYVLGFFQSQNKIYIDDGDTRAPLDIGYRNMFFTGAPLYDFGWQVNTTTSTAAINNNMLIDTLTPFIEKYVTYVVLDNHVVYITNAGYTADYVIIDSFAEVDETGIKVNAWSTVTDKYDVINIDEFNGWDVGGIDWQAYYQTAIFQAMLGGSLNITDYLAQYIPVKTGEIYRVVYSNGADYNLTNAGAPAVSDDATFAVKDSYIHQIYQGKYIPDASVALNSQQYTRTNASDFWLVRVVEEQADGSFKTVKIYGRTGHLSNVEFYGVDIYKAGDHDYVISGTAEQLKNFLAMAGYADSSIQYVVYKQYTNGLDNDLWLQQNNGYSSRYMWDVLTNSWTNVKFDMTKLNEIRNGLAANGEGPIYLVVDGVLSSLEPVDMADIAAYVKSAKTFNHTGMVAVRLEAATGAQIIEAAQEAMDQIFYANLNTAQYDYITAAALTFIGIDNEGGVKGPYYNIKGNASGAAATIGSATLQNVTLYVFYKADMTAVVLVDSGIDSYSGTIVAYEAYESKDADGNLTGVVETEIPADITVTFKDATGVLTVTVAPTDMTLAGGTLTADFLAAAATATIADNVATFEITDVTAAEGEYLVTLTNGSLSVDFGFSID